MGMYYTPRSVPPAPAPPPPPPMAANLCHLLDLKCFSQGLLASRNSCRMANFFIPDLGGCRVACRRIPSEQASCEVLHAAMKFLAASSSSACGIGQQNCVAARSRSRKCRRQEMLFPSALRGQSVSWAAAPRVHLRRARQLRAATARAAADTQSLGALFTVLGLAPTASKEEIKKAYRRLALKVS